MEKKPLDRLPRVSFFSYSSVFTRSFFIIILAILVLIHQFRAALLDAISSNSYSKNDDPSFNEGDSISWESCGQIAGRDLECSTIHVPLDHFATNNSTDLEFHLPLARLRGHNGAKNLIVSPGGPGVSGIEFLHNRGELLDSIVGSDLHIVAFDVRGVGGSKPAALCYKTRADKARLSIAQFKSIDESREAYEWTKGFVRGCQDVTGEYGPYINTIQIAGDMNMILDMLNQTEMYYWGISWGTVLGQVYATIYPERAHHMIIDGVVDHTKWYQNQFPDSGLKDAERVLYGFFDECIKAGSECPLSYKAGTAMELQDEVLNVVQNLASEPRSVYVDDTHWGVLHFNDLLYNGLFGALYSPAAWWLTADRLAKLLQGSANEAFLAWAGQGPYDDWMKDEAAYFISCNDQLSGPQHWPQDRETFLDLVKPLLNETLFSPILHLELYKQQQWPFPKTHTFQPAKKVKTSHPMLVMSMEWDPVTPLEATQSALDVFEGSSLVKLAGYGHTTFAMKSACIARHVYDYLYNGTLPVEDTTCKVDNKYFVKPNGS